MRDAADAGPARAEMTQHPAMGMIDVYLNTVPDFEHRGTLHVAFGAIARTHPARFIPASRARSEV